ACAEEELSVELANIEWVSPPANAKPKASSRNCKAARDGENLDEVERRLGTGTIKSACFAVLKTAGPAGLSLADIVQCTQQLNLKNWENVKQPTNTINAILSMDSAFVRTAPGRFALRASEKTVCVGQTVMRMFAKEDQEPVWVEATVADYDAMSSQHRLVYRANTSEESFEWLDLATIDAQTVQCVGDQAATRGGAYKCDGCSKAFDSVGGLRMHAARWCSKTPGDDEHFIDSSKILTPVVSVKASPASAKRPHINLTPVTDGGTGYQCDQCARRFESACGLRISPSRWAFNSACGLRMHASRWCPLRPGATTEEARKEAMLNPELTMLTAAAQGCGLPLLVVTCP
ncbi:hypothetical protein CYMTET_31192, partial [Cymbomonas tetramitiformis]